MARRLELHVNWDDRDAPAFITNFDDYGVILYYAFIVDEEKAFILYRAMVSEYYFKIGYGIPLGNTTEDDIKADLPLSKLQNVISFINDDILPSLNTLPPELDMVDEWNIEYGLESFLMNRGSFFNNFNIDGIQDDGFTVRYFIGVFNQLRDFFADALKGGKPYKVDIA